MIFNYDISPRYAEQYSRHLGAAGARQVEQNSMTKIPMTAAGHSALEGELKHRIAVERPRLIQRVQEAIADDTNLAENSDYQIAKAEQQTNEARMSNLKISSRAPK